MILTGIYYEKDELEKQGPNMAKDNGAPKKPLLPWDFKAARGPLRRRKRPCNSLAYQHAHTRTGAVCRPRSLAGLFRVVASRVGCMCPYFEAELGARPCCDPGTAGLACNLDELPVGLVVVWRRY